MTAAHAARIGWARWHLARPLAAITTWLERRRGADLFGWGDDGRTGRIPVMDDEIRQAFAHSAEPEPVVVDLPPLDDLPDDGWRAVTGAPLRSLTTWLPDAWLLDVPAVTAPPLAGTAAAPPAEHRVSDAAAEAGGGAVLSLPPAHLPEWVRMLLDGDLETAVARDVEHCTRMGWAA